MLSLALITEFKPCALCSKSVPLSDPHLSCLKCYGEAHKKDRCQICKEFKPQIQNNQAVRLKVLLMEAALKPALELHWDSAPSTSASVQSILHQSWSPGTNHLPWCARRNTTSTRRRADLGCRRTREKARPHGGPLFILGASPSGTHTQTTAAL